MAIGQHSKGRGKERSKAAQPAGKQVASTSLAWSAVPLPLEATAQAGQSDADFYQGFSFDDDDFMGLTEVDNVEVVRADDGIVQFVARSDDAIKGQKGKAKAVDVPPPAKKVKAKKAQKAEKELGTGETKAADDASPVDVDLPPAKFDDEDVEDEEVAPQLDDAQDTSQGIAANFALLTQDDDDGRMDVKDAWTAKELAKKLPQWKLLKIPLDPLLYHALHAMEFHKPTAIQAETLPLSIGSAYGDRPVLRDVIGVAQTGSGKTLAYGLPILHWIASHSHVDRQMRLLDGVPDEDLTSRLAGLILTPTRELAIQVANHLQQVVQHSSQGNKRWASIATVTGGMSEEKQRRALQGYRGRGVDVIVATPGRLWEMCRGDDDLARRIKTTRFLVVDEADRMIETGHFAEMQHLFALVQRYEADTNAQAANANLHLARVVGGAEDMQTLIFSATLSKDLQHNLKRANRKRKRGQTATTLDELLTAIDFRDDEPHMVDQSTSTRIATNVVEIKSECLAQDKDLHLYYFLLRYPGRTLVFLNSIDGIRRLQPLLQNLQIDVHPLHSQLQQRQRLRNMDRFRAASASGSGSVLLATDVAARGLDIPAVDHVVHFQIPRTADTYVHRSGRTARGGREGVSLALIEPKEKRAWLDLCKGLRRTDDLDQMPLEFTFLKALKQRVTLARQIDSATHKAKKESHDDAWLRKLAQEVEIDLSDDEMDRDRDATPNSKKKNGKESSTGKASNGKAAALKRELDHLLTIPLRARGVSTKYITSGSRPFVEGMLEDTQHDKLIGVERRAVQKDVEQASKKKAKASATAQPVEEGKDAANAKTGDRKRKRG